MAFPPCPVWLLQLTILQGVAGSKTACGQPEHSAETGGVQPIPQGSWPWQTSIRTNGTHICGGSIIDQQWVLSAAHCFPEYITASQYEVVLGAYHLSDNFSCITTLSVQRIIRHPNYNGRSDYSRDVAVVKLTSPVNFTNYIMPICLPDYSVPFSTDMECWVTGWQGTQSEEPSEVPQTPPELEMPPTDQSRFHKPFNVYRVEIWSKKSIKRDTICAGCQESERGLCQGDAGGPLACKLKKGWTQVGILSWGTGCTESSHPDVYVSVPFYTKWIQETVYNKKESEKSGGLWNSSNKLTLFLTLVLLALL